MSFYIHCVPGRIRIKIPLLKGNPKKACEIQQLLQTLEGIDSISVNTVTGSLLLSYNPSILNVDLITHCLERNNYFDTSLAVTHDDYIKHAADRAGKALARVFLGWAVGKALESTGLGFLAVFI